MDDVNCTGTELKLVDCPYDKDTLDCEHCHDIGVYCSYDIPSKCNCYIINGVE